MWGHPGDHTWWWWGFGTLHMLLYWGVIILVIALLVKWLFGKSSDVRVSGGKTALDILKARYARGEINKEEFEQKKRDLEG